MFLLGYLLERSPVRREAIANRDRDIVARSLGLPILRLRITTFILGSAVAGFAGSLWAHRASSISVDEFGVDLGLGIFLMLILGGIGSMWGSLLGAWFYVYVRERLQRLHIHIGHQSISEFWGIIYGSLLILVMVLLPDGIVGLGRRVRRISNGTGRRSFQTTWPVASDSAARTSRLPARPSTGVAPGLNAEAAPTETPGTPR